MQFCSTLWALESALVSCRTGKEEYRCLANKSIGTQLCSCSYLWARSGEAGYVATEADACGTPQEAVYGASGVPVEKIGALDRFKKRKIGD